MSLAGPRRDSILLVDDDRTAIAVMAKALAGLGELRFATDGADALRLAGESPPDLVLMDAEMPGMSGFEACEALKASPTLADIPVIFVTSHCAPHVEVRGLELGAADFISKPINPLLLAARARTQLRLKRMSDELRRLSHTDPLTGLANRRRFTDRALVEMQRAAREKTPLTVLLLDVDHFKRFNDHYGHPAGDTCLRAVAECIAGVVMRPADLVARLGGEEFAMLLPNTDLAGGRHVASRVIGALKQARIAHAASPVAAHLTMSVGVAMLDTVGADALRREPGCGCTPPEALEQLLERADRALYRAKEAGRNRACVDADGSVARCLRTGDAVSPPG